MHGPADPHIYILPLKSIGRMNGIDIIIVSILTVNIKLPALINCIGMHESFLLAAVSHKIMYHMIQAWTPPYT